MTRRPGGLQGSANIRPLGAGCDERLVVRTWSARTGEAPKPRPRARHHEGGFLRVARELPRVVITNIERKKGRRHYGASRFAATSAAGQRGPLPRPADRLGLGGSESGPSRAACLGPAKGHRRGASWRERCELDPIGTRGGRRTRSRRITSQRLARPAPFALASTGRHLDPDDDGARCRVGRDPDRHHDEPD